MEMVKQFKYQDDETKVWGNLFLVSNWQGSDSDLKLQPEEVDSVEWWPIADISKKEVKITPDSLFAFNEIQGFL